MPIYGRGGDQTDPRKKRAASGGKEEPAEPVPRRPLGQRPLPVNVRHMVSFTSDKAETAQSKECTDLVSCGKPCLTPPGFHQLLRRVFGMQRAPAVPVPAAATVQPTGLNIIPTLFGLSGQGMLSVLALRMRPHHLTYCDSLLRLTFDSVWCLEVST